MTFHHSFTEGFTFSCGVSSFAFSWQLSEQFINPLGERFLVLRLFWVLTFYAQVAPYFWLISRRARFEYRLKCLSNVAISLIPRAAIQAAV